MKTSNTQDLTETCVVLAGGLGTRLRGISGGRNKHTCLIAGKMALQHVLEPIYASPSVRKVAIVIQPDAKSWINELLSFLQPHSETCLCIQPVPNGTLAAVQCALTEVDTEIFSVHFGDNIFGWTRLPDLTRFAATLHAAELYTVEDLTNAHEFGILEVEETEAGPRACGFCEKPSSLDGLRHPCIVTGFFRFRKKAFINASDAVKVSIRGELELTATVKKLLELPRGVSTYATTVSWADFGTPENLLRAEKVLQERKQSMSPRAVSLS